MRLIDADDLRDSWLGIVGNDFKASDFVFAIDTTPTVDPKTAHGRWVWNDYGGVGNYHCSVCRKICMCNGDYAYCPNCGARMKPDETD